MVKDTNEHARLSAMVALVVGLWVLFPVTVWLLDDLPSGAGEFGDMYGCLNALFSGLALAGVIYAVLLQRQELSLQREELAAQLAEMQQSRAVFEQQLAETRRATALQAQPILDFQCDGVLLAANARAVRHASATPLHASTRATIFARTSVPAVNVVATAYLISANTSRVHAEAVILADIVHPTGDSSGDQFAQGPLNDADVAAMLASVAADEDLVLLQRVVYCNALGAAFQSLRMTRVPLDEATIRLAGSWATRKPSEQLQQLLDRVANSSDPGAADDIGQLQSELDAEYGQQGLRLAPGGATVGFELRPFHPGEEDERMPPITELGPVPVWLGRVLPPGSGAIGRLNDAVKRP